MTTSAKSTIKLHVATTLDAADALPIKGRHARLAAGLRDGIYNGRQFREWLDDNQAAWSARYTNLTETEA